MHISIWHISEKITTQAVTYAQAETETLGILLTVSETTEEGLANKGTAHTARRLLMLSIGDDGREIYATELHNGAIENQRAIGVAQADGVLLFRTFFYAALSRFSLNYGETETLYNAVWQEWTK